MFNRSIIKGFLCVVYSNLLLWFCRRNVLLLLTLCLLYVPNYEVSGQDVGVIDPDTIFPNLTIEYRNDGNFDYYTEKGYTIAGGRKQADGSYLIYYKGRIKQRGFIAGTEPKKSNDNATTKRDDVRDLSTNESVSSNLFEPRVIRDRPSYPVSSTVVRDRGGEVVRSNIDKTTYDSNGRPYYRWNSSEMSTSHIKDPRVRAEVREAQNKTDARQRAADRQR